MSPIASSELYGGEAEATAATADRSAQYARFEVPRAAPPDAPLQPPFAARALLVDNLSGVWYAVNGRRIAPWTVAGVVRLDTPSDQLELTVSTPPGQLSEDAGEALVLIATDAELEPSAGLFTPPAVAVGFATARYNRVLDESAPGTGDNALEEALTGTAASRLVIVGVTVAAYADIRAPVRVSWHRGADLNEQVALVSLSPGAPVASVDWPPGAMVLGDGVGLWITGRSAEGGGQLDVDSVIRYYRVLA